MRNTLEDLYYGNITPNAQDMVPNSELKRATDRMARFEKQLTEQLDETGQAVLAKLIENLYSQRKMLGGRGIFSPDKARFRRNTLCIARKRNAVWRKKTRPHGV